MQCMTANDAANGERSTQWLRGVLDVCLLGILGLEPAYGYEMTRRLTESGLSSVAEGSIYPALARLERASLVESFRMESPDGPSRKYYRRTPAGDREFERARKAWATFASSIDQVLNADVESAQSPHFVAEESQ
ncbi:MAG: hypothetical protein RI900_3249 [Actinomycetota bacterium]|jgi:PadR family transcriptional regulator, regulatory protein PadR